MIRNRRPVGLAVVIGLGVLSLVAGALPARAGDASWSDPQDDATALGEFERTPLPSDPGLDITRSTLSTKDGDLTWVVKIKDLPGSGYPSAATGFFFRLFFNYSGTPFNFLVYDDAAAGHFFVLRQLTGGGTGNIACGGCEGVIDRTTDSVIVTAPIAALADGLAERDLQFGPGSRLIPSSVYSYRLFAGSTGRTADISDAPRGTTHTV